MKMYRGFFELTQIFTRAKELSVPFALLAAVIAATAFAQYLSGGNKYAIAGTVSNARLCSASENAAQAKSKVLRVHCGGFLE